MAAWLPGERVVRYAAAYRRGGRALPARSFEARAAPWLFRSGRSSASASPALLVDRACFRRTSFRLQSDNQEYQRMKRLVLSLACLSALGFAGSVTAEPPHGK